MTSCFSLISLVAAATLYSAALSAQDEDKGAVERTVAEILDHASGAAIDARFMANAPDIGEPMPDITIFDDQGNPVSLRELTSRGRYTVLTLGCLT